MTSPADCPECGEEIDVPDTLGDGEPAAAGGGSVAAERRQEHGLLAQAVLSLAVLHRQIALAVDRKDGEPLQPVTCTCCGAALVVFLVSAPDGEGGAYVELREAQS